MRAFEKHFLLQWTDGSFQRGLAHGFQQNRSPACVEMIIGIVIRQPPLCQSLPVGVVVGIWCCRTYSQR